MYVCTCVCIQVKGLKGQNFRLFKDNLDKDIIPEESKFSIKKNRVNVSLKKVSKLRERWMIRGGCGAARPGTGQSQGIISLSLLLSCV